MAKKAATKKTSKNPTSSRSTPADAKPAKKPAAKRKVKAAPSKSKSALTTKAKPKSKRSEKPSEPPSLTCATPPTVPLRPPDWLKPKPIACAKWYELLGSLQSRKLIDTIDLDLFALYCDAWQEFYEADDGMRNGNRWFETDKGYVAVHPAKLMRDKAVETIQRLADRLGIGVNKRRGLKVVNPNADEDDNSDPIARYAKQKPRLN